MREMLTILTFLVVAIRSRTFFPISHIQLANMCAGAGREHSQAASPSWPEEVFHTIDITLSLGMTVGRVLGISSFSLP